MCPLPDHQASQKGSLLAWAGLVIKWEGLVGMWEGLVHWMVVGAVPLGLVVVRLRG